MPTDAVTIVIEADDKASAQAASAARNIEQSVKGVKETGQKAKASTEFIGVLAGQLGGSQFQTAAQGVAAITEKVGQFSEVMKVGGAGAMAFQAGIAGLVGVMSFNLGKSIGESIFGVQAFGETVADTRAEVEAFTQKMIEFADENFKDKLEDISLIKDPNKQQAEAVATFEAVQAEVNKAYDNIHHRQRELEKLMNATNLDTGIEGVLGYLDVFEQVDQAANRVDNSERISQLQLEQEQYANQITALEKQKKALGELYGTRANAIKQQKQDQAAAEAAEAKKKQIEQSSINRLNQLNDKYTELTEGSTKALEAQLKREGVSEMDRKAILLADELARKAQANFDAKKKAEDDEKARIQKIEELRKSESARLEEQKILLTQGEQAAHSFRLQQQGLAKADADRIAAEQAGIDRLKKQKEQAAKIAEKPTLMAFESRLTMRGPSEDTQKNIAENTLRTVDKLDEVKTAIQNMPKAQQGEALQITRIG